MEGSKIKKNVILGFSSEILSVILGILVPRLVLTSYGSEINGLLTSVTQIYSYISLLEAGIGTATVQALYKTLGQEDRTRTNAVLAATNKYYHRTGLLYLLAITLFSIIYPFIIQSNISIVTIVLVIILNGIGSVISFFFQGKYLLLLQADGKNYIMSAMAMVINVFKNVAKIVLMAMGVDVVVVQAISMIVSLVQMLFVSWYINRYYAWIDLTVEPDVDAISQSKNVLVHQLSGLVFNNTDTLILTIACGLKTVSVYSMYTLLFGMVSMTLNTISNSVLYYISQTFHVDRDRYKKLLDVFEVYYMAVVFALYSIANFFILPFIKLYTSGVTDVNYLDEKLPLMFIATYLLSCGRKSSNITITTAGHFRLTQGRSVAEAAINLVVSIIAVQSWEIYGVLLGTIIALLYRTNDMIWYANKKILHRNPWTVYRRWGVDIALFIGIIFLNRYITVQLNSYISIFAFCIPYAVIVLTLYMCVVSIFDLKTARYALQIIRNDISAHF